MNLRSCIVLMGFLSSLAACRPIFIRQKLASVLSVEGEVRATKGTQKFPLTKSKSLEVGTEITVPPGAQLDLMLLPGILLELSGETEIVLTQLRLERDGDESIHPMVARRAALELVRGSLVALVGQTQTRSRLLVKTRSGAITAGSGRTFAITFKNSAHIMSVRGRITFEPASGAAATRIDAGYFAIAGSTLTLPKAASNSTSEIQGEVTRLLSAEKRLARLQDEARQTFPDRTE